MLKIGINMADNYITDVKDEDLKIIGVAYKKDLGDWRESPALMVIDYLLQDKITISYHDPYVSQIEVQDRIYSHVELTEETISGADLVIITTDHSHIDYRNLVAKSKAVLDTRGITRHLDCLHDKVTLL
ncbi:MAG: UDP binding domain-containing protein [Sphaerospermopsis kisseleviana]